MQVLSLLFLEEMLRGMDVDSLACICDLKGPFDVVFVEAEFVHHICDGTIDWVLDLRSKRRWCQDGVEWRAAREWD